jgi:16S rRNA (cytosine1402-N4)-methyltransferase
MAYAHVPVMLAEALFYLNCKPNKIYVDGTLGGCGHAGAILDSIMPGGLLIGIDRDRDAIENAKQTLKKNKNFLLYHDSYEHLPEIFSHAGIAAADGILLDLGMSYHQIEHSGRGFSFSKDEPLDMRMDIQGDVTAEYIINAWEADALCHIFKTYGEERWARSVAKKIVVARKKRSITTSRQLADIICNAIPKWKTAQHRIHPATRIFMALRIAVNRELDILNVFMKQVGQLLNPKGRLCVISFHSLEDRIVKQGIRNLEGRCTCPPELPVCGCQKNRVAKALMKKPVRPNPTETAKNPLARSARLRAMEKI